LRERSYQATFWLLIVGSWTTGVIYGRWMGGGGLLEDLGQAVSVPSSFGRWWEPLVYFVLSVVAIFVLSQIFFGGGAVIFTLARGVRDNLLISELETTLRTWSFLNMGAGEICKVLLIALIFAVNLPLFLWSAHLGTQRSLYVLHRLKGKPVPPELGSRPFSNFLLVLAASMIVGLIATLIFSYAK